MQHTDAGSIRTRLQITGCTPTLVSSVCVDTLLLRLDAVAHVGNAFVDVSASTCL